MMRTEIVCYVYDARYNEKNINMYHESIHYIAFPFPVSETEPANQRPPYKWGLGATAQS